MKIEFELTPGPVVKTLAVPGIMIALGAAFYLITLIPKFTFVTAGLGICILLTLYLLIRVKYDMFMYYCGKPNTISCYMEYSDEVIRRVYHESDLVVSYIAQIALYGALGVFSILMCSVLFEGLPPQ